MTISNIILLCSATFTALMAGLFYTFSFSVVTGLGRLSDTEYIAAMQSINRAILNPVFYIVFFGTLIFLPLSTYMNYTQPVSSRFWFLLAATLIYFLGAFGVTVFGNIPLNNTLDSFIYTDASTETIRLQRTMFEAKWNTLNMIRTLASTASLILVIMACLQNTK